MKNPLDFLLDFLNSYDKGQIFLPAGKHAYKILTKKRPISVSVSEVSNDNIPVCHGNVNMYGWTLDVDGFVFYADIASNTAEIEWQAILDINK